MCFLQPVDRLILTGILKQKTHRLCDLQYAVQIYVLSDHKSNARKFSI